MSIKSFYCVALALLILTPFTWLVAGGRYIYDKVVAFPVDCLRADYALPLMWVDRFKIAAFKVIGSMKPEYFASYKTNGLNLLSAGLHRSATC